MAFSKISLFFQSGIRALLEIYWLSNLWKFVLSVISSLKRRFEVIGSSINSYRASLNLTSLTTNENAECLADELAEEFKNQPCTNSTGANTVPGTEPQDGAVMPACVPNLAPSLVLTNFTQSQYSGNLNETKYTGIGIGSEGDWIVVVLTTSTTEGNYATATTAATTSAANSVSKITIIHHLLLLLMAAFYML
ncbi:hypothetical protein V6Z11_1Z136300 [Gossypium hirsutum]